jgi:hypothetical protein
MSIHNGNQKKRKRLIRLHDTIGAILGKIAIVLVILLICAQGALQNESVRHLLSGADRWEGRAFH